MNNVDRQQSVKRRSGYTSVPNAVMADTRLSIEARGLLALLMTFKDGWVFRSSHLMKQCGVGRDKYYRMVGELKSLAYVIVVQNKTADGQFLNSHWEINDSPCPEKPDTGEPESGKPAHLRETNSVRETKGKNPPNPQGDDVLFPELEQQTPPDRTEDLINEGFDEFWKDIWPAHSRKNQKADCLKVYSKACKGEHKKADAISPAALNKAARRYIASVTDLQFLKGPLPWLNAPGWEAFMDQSDQASLDWSTLSDSQRRMLQRGECPPSMMEDGHPNATAKAFMAQVAK